MKRAAFIILFITLCVMVDYTQATADRVLDVSSKRMDDLTRREVEDWAITNYLSVGLLAFGIFWTVLVNLQPQTTYRRALRGCGRGGVIMAAIVGIGMSLGLEAWFAVTGVKSGFDRLHCEMGWIFGALFGGILGMMFGTLFDAVRSSPNKRS